MPLTRAGLGEGAAARHVTAAAWVALTVIGGSVGAFAVAGGKIVESLLGDAYGGDIGEEVSRLVVVLAPWMVASVGVNVSFPLAFVAGRLRKLPVIGACALALQVALAWIGSELLQLDGLAVALTLSTLLVLAALLGELGALDAGLRGILRAAAAIAGCRARRVRAGEPPPRRGAGRDRRCRALRGARRRVAPARPHGVVGLPARPALSAVR